MLESDLFNSELSDEPTNFTGASFKDAILINIKNTTGTELDSNVSKGV